MERFHNPAVFLIGVKGPFTLEAKQRINEFQVFVSGSPSRPKRLAPW